MTALLTSKQPVKGIAVLEPGMIAVPKRRRRRQTVKKRLLILMGGLALLCILPILLVYALAMKPQITTCGELLRAADYPQVVHLQAQSQEMAAIQLVDNLAGASQAALVQVTNHVGPRTLDVYVFGCTMRRQRPQLTRLLAQRRLAQGTVELTPEHTLITKALDTQISAGLVPFLQPLQQNIYHEYAWQQNGFAQVPFPGFYPVTSRAEANALQRSADDGQTMPWNDPVTTALQMSKDLLQWSPDPQAQVLSRVGDTAVISLTRQSPHVVLAVTLKQLIRPDSTGLWFVTDARTRGMLLTNPGTLAQPLAVSQNSPIHFSGASALIDGQTTATLFDHTMAPISQAANVPLQVRRDSSYAGTLSYASLASGQQGVLLIESMPKAENFAYESGQMLLTGIILK